MKWQFEYTDTPVNINYPVTGYQVSSNGIKRGPYFFTLENFINAFLSQTEKDEMISTPALPNGTICYSSNKTQTTYQITLEISQKQWDIRYADRNNNESFHSIGFPRMIIQFTLKKVEDQYQITKTRIFAVLNNQEPITNDTKLYSFPYPNVYKDTGVVCWGGNQRLTLKDLTDLGRMFRWFVGSPFNEDLGVRSTHGISNFQKLINVIEDQPFNDDWLIPTTLTFRDLIE